MNVKRKFIGILAGCFFALSMTVVNPIYAEDFLPSIKDMSLLPQGKKSMDEHWLPDIVGMPNEEQVENLTQHVAEVMAEEQDKQCNAIDYNLRMLIFQNFVIYQHMANAQHYYFKDKIIQKYAHILAMILKESSGDPTNITDMTGRSTTTSKAGTTLQRWKNLLKISKQSGIKLNSQTNLGLTQLSVDRLFVAFKIAHGEDHSKDFLAGKYGDATPERIDLDTTIAIRRLIWFYQDFAQGRLTQEDKRIHEEDIYKPEFNERYQTGLKMALLYCGTQFLFNAKNQYIAANEYSNHEQIMASIAYCKLGNPERGYGKQQIDELCFAEWVTFCPALNMNIALLTPLSYFQTRGSKPVCTGTLNRLLIKDPTNQ